MRVPQGRRTIIYNRGAEATHTYTQPSEVCTSATTSHMNAVGNAPSRTLADARGPGLWLATGHREARGPLYHRGHQKVRSRRRRQRARLRLPAQRADGNSRKQDASRPSLDTGYMTTCAALRARAPASDSNSKFVPKLKYKGSFSDCIPFNGLRRAWAATAAKELDQTKANVALKPEAHGNMMEPKQQSDVREVFPTLAFQKPKSEAQLHLYSTTVRLSTLEVTPPYCSESKRMSTVVVRGSMSG